MLNGRTALIVEEEFLIALDIQRMLEALGVGQTLFARNVAEARQLRHHWPDVALAVVELRRGDSEDQPLHDDLAGAGIPIVITTGDFALSRKLASKAPVIVKPIPEEALASAVAQALAARS
ncbi:CheY chemotaxis protein or a CheY-like REC (receiver) domain [Devosia sp. YR412]|uniref:hypothetical protein n=1 Tax=Devosia sp. YR412 TaxID=1881030 RepID=UPI0008CE906F|nr:hypothetical protein [Devosia sp. YR412]SEQ08109.1 CheY chemotaxis protein or a CheY-like REC (receiver) domain [Devosia sp. YR412]